MLMSNKAWRYYGTVFYMQPVDANLRCPDGFIGVNRAYNNGALHFDTNHRYSTSDSIMRDMERDGCWTYEATVHVLATLEARERVRECPAVVTLASRSSAGERSVEERLHHEADHRQSGQRTALGIHERIGNADGAARVSHRCQRIKGE